MEALISMETRFFTDNNFCTQSAEELKLTCLSPDPKRIGGYSDQPGVRPSVRLSVCPSVRPSVRP